MHGLGKQKDIWTFANSLLTLKNILILSIHAFWRCFQQLSIIGIEKHRIKTHEGLIYLFKINYVDTGLFDRGLFRFYCITKELNTEFFRLNFDAFDERTALEVFEKSTIFVDYSMDFVEKNSHHVVFR